MRSPSLRLGRSLASANSNEADDEDSAMKNIFAKAPSNDTAQTRRNFCIVLAVIIVTAIFVLPALSGERGGALRSIAFPTKFRIAVISDPDKKSKVADKHEWRSKYMTGSLERDGESYSIKWEEPIDLGTPLNEGGRGAELSELVRFDGALFSFDDRTGIMFEIANPENSASRDASALPHLVPRQIFMEGNGENGKGMKFEWATVKDGLLYIGSFGKEFTNTAGKVVHTNNLWVVIVDKEGKATHVDWTDRYDKMRAELGLESPGYMIHEAVIWSPESKRWFVLPRRMSKDKYDEEQDEFKGANSIVIASPDFSKLEHVTVGEITPRRGFSTAKFLPGSKDKVIIALKSEENTERDRQTSYMTIYGQAPSGEWRVLMPELELPHEHKFEGLEVLSWS